MGVCLAHLFRCGLQVAVEVLGVSILACLAGAQAAGIAGAVVVEAEPSGEVAQVGLDGPDDHEVAPNQWRSNFSGSLTVLRPWLVVLTHCRKDAQVGEPEGQPEPLPHCVQGRLVAHLDLVVGEDAAH
eukprot:13021655-Alexandrium_andersonii.AAC.1